MSSVSSVWWVFLFTLFCVALFGVIALVWWTQKRIGLPRGGTFGRIAQWAEGVRRSEAEVKTATVGDLVLFVTLYVIGVTLCITLYIGLSSGSEERSKQEIDDLTRTTQGQAQQLKGDEEELAKFRGRLYIPEQISPAADEEIIGAHIGFQWKYGNHNSASRYVLQLMKIASGHEDELENNGAGVNQQTPVGKVCIFAATDSTDQRATLPNQVEARGEFPEGTYIWRVASGELNVTHDPAECVEDDQVRYWSAFRKFTFFSSRKRRIRATDEIIVGTQFSQDTPFSRVGDDGRPSGFDMDLIRVLVEGCLLNDGGKVRFDKTSCQSAVAAECDAIQARSESSNTHLAAKLCGSAASTAGTPNSLPGTHLHIRLVPLVNGADWKDALQRRNIDVYVGSSTKAKERETGDVAYSDEYLGYETEFLVDQNETCETLHCLATNNRKLGVVPHTSNAWLANELHKQDDLRTLQIVPFDSFPLLETAFEKHDVAAVIVDGTMKRSLGLTSPKSLNDDLKKQSGWHAYLSDFIGHDGREGFAMATVDDIVDIDDTFVKSKCAPETSAKRKRICEIDRKLAANRNLLNQLNAALESDSVAMLINVLFQEYELDKWDALPRRTDGGAHPSTLQSVTGMLRQRLASALQ